MIIASSSSAELPLILVLQKRCIWGTIWSLWCGTWFWCASHLAMISIRWWRYLRPFSSLFRRCLPFGRNFWADIRRFLRPLEESYNKQIQKRNVSTVRPYDGLMRADGKASMITQRSKSSSADLDWSSCLWRRFRVEDLCRRALLNHVMLNHSFFSYLLSMFIHFHPQFLLWYFFSSSANHALVNQQISPWQGRKVWF